MTTLLLPLYVAPAAAPEAWRACLAACLTPPPTGTRRYVVVDDPVDPEVWEAAEQLTKAGNVVLGRVAAGFALRPLADLLDEVERSGRRPRHRHPAGPGTDESVFVGTGVLGHSRGSPGGATDRVVEPWGPDRPSLPGAGSAGLHL